jgi:AraC-like DNA-binding protein
VLAASSAIRKKASRSLGQGLIPFATMLPATSADYLRAVVDRDSIVTARSWGELEMLLEKHLLSSVLIDPSAAGIEVSSASRLIAKHRSTPFLTYTPLTAESLRVVAELSKFGLADAIVHPAPAQTILRVVERVFIHPLAQSFLTELEPSFAHLPPGVVAAILDLFRRPRRYASGADVGREAGITSTTLENSMNGANLGPAKKLVILAKLLLAHEYLRESHHQVGFICKRVGYAHRRVFAEHTRVVFWCSPLALRSRNPDEILMTALEWFYKPHCRSALSTREENTRSSEDRGIQASRGSAPSYARISRAKKLRDAATRDIRKVLVSSQR